ncbi:type II toxin-antitoxin system HicA family toxin [Selenomonas massiliensis]|uniref:type II toxin-antitoxin system HicA family toxin n=1 Tax=Selenomonas massiliensis TaxID=2058293 RepID=UPI000D0E3F6C|nr:type II toxin-antitoxin system HicA family toxin [Selenomonas massiliensis]
MPMTARQMIRLLEKNGFRKAVSSSGSHQKMWNPLTRKTTVVPIHAGTLGKGLGHKILKQAGLI